MAPPGSPDGLRETPITAQAAAAAARDHLVVLNVTRRTTLAVTLLLLFLLQLAPPAEGSEAMPSVVTLSGVGGSLTAWPSRHRVEVTVDGAGSMVFEDARVLVRASRITVVARTKERTLFAWANRTNDTGAIGLLVRGPDHRKRPQAFAVMVQRVAVNGVQQLALH